MYSPILIAYYSMTGHTRLLAGQIGELVGARSEEIREARERRGLAGEVRALSDSLVRRALPILKPVCDPGEYELLLLGGPVWAGHVAAPLRTYARDFGAKARRVAFFCTYDADGAERALGELAQLCGKAPESVLAVPAHALVSGAHEAELRRFVGEALAPLEARRSAA